MRSEPNRLKGWMPELRICVANNYLVATKCNVKGHLVASGIRRGKARKFQTSQIHVAVFCTLFKLKVVRASFSTSDGENKNGALGNVATSQLIE